MIEVGVPESVADFMNGRRPGTVGAQHYMFLRRQADEHNPKYLEYLKEFMRKVG